MLHYAVVTDFIFKKLWQPARIDTLHCTVISKVIGQWLWQFACIYLFVYLTMLLSVTVLLRSVKFLLLLQFSY